MLRSFVWGNRYDAERIAERLDPVAALAGLVARAVAGTCTAALEVLNDMLRPQVFLIGGIGTIVVAYLLYYALWAFLAKTLFLWLILPGLAVVVACWYVHFQRMNRLSTALFQAAWHALDPATYHAPR